MVEGATGGSGAEAGSFKQMKGIKHWGLKKNKLVLKTSQSQNSSQLLWTQTTDYFLTLCGRDDGCLPFFTNSVQILGRMYEKRTAPDRVKA